MSAHIDRVADPDLEGHVGAIEAGAPEQRIGTRRRCDELVTQRVDPGVFGGADH